MYYNVTFLDLGVVFESWDTILEIKTEFREIKERYKEEEQRYKTSLDMEAAYSINFIIHT